MEILIKMMLQDFKEDSTGDAGNVAFQVAWAQDDPCWS